jgi:hypothetical protein
MYVVAAIHRDAHIDVLDAKPRLTANSLAVFNGSWALETR